MPSEVYQRAKKSPEERFREKVVIDPSGCWKWAGGRIKGYAQFSVGGKYVLAHRWSYEHHVGPIPPGLVIDHLCRTPCCVNPAHLEPVPMRVNTERGVLYETLTANAKKKTHCKRGHPLFGDNLRIDSRGDRGCRSCQAMKAREWKAANLARVNERQQERRSKRPKPERLIIRRTCHHCACEFEAKRSDARYCTVYCYKVAWRLGKTIRRRPIRNHQPVERNMSECN
jgi:hypothetical protein